MMHDLDEQLAAFGRYLDDLEDSRIDAVLTPMPADHHSRRVWVLRAAVVVAVLAAAAVVTLLLPDRDSRVESPSEPSRWVTIPDPDGLFTPSTGSGDGTAPGGSTSLDSIRVESIASTTRGLVAVGAETTNDTTVGAVWQSDDGIEWTRLAHDPSFGTARFTGAPGPTLRDVAEHDGRIAVLGYWPNDEIGRAWWSDDLETWASTRLPASSSRSFPQAVALTGGDAGFVAVGGGIWTSPDAEHWTAADVDSDGIFFSDVAFVDDRYVAAGTTLQGRLAVWTSTDGMRWTLSTVDNAADEAPSSGWYAVAAYGDVVLVVATGHDDDAAQPEPAVWRSTDGASTWQKVEGMIAPRDPNQYVADVIVGTTDGFVAIAHRHSSQGEMNVEFRSTDGLTWASTSLDVRGWRSDAVAFEDGVVAVGQQAEPQAIGTSPQAQAEFGDEYALMLSASIWVTNS